VLETDGAVLLEGLVADERDKWHRLTDCYFALGKPGVRITGDGALAIAVRELLERPALCRELGEGHWRCVRAIAFDKAPQANWALAWHQDRTIAVLQWRGLAQ
jgi:hypothetical protein